MAGVLLVLGLLFGLAFVYEQTFDRLLQSGETVYRTVYSNCGTITKPLEVGAGDRSRNAQVKIGMMFRVNDDSGFGNLFQTDDSNKGARLEIHHATAALVVANSGMHDGYDIYVIPRKIVKHRWYRLDVEVQNRGYVNLSLDGEKIIDVNDRKVFASMSRLIVGRGFDDERVFDGDVGKIEVKVGKASMLQLFLIQLRSLNLESYLRVLGNALVLSLALMFWQQEKIGDVENRIAGVVRANRRLLLVAAVAIQFFLVWGFDVYRVLVSGYVLLFVMGGVLYPLIVPSGVLRMRTIPVLLPILGMIVLSILGGYLIGYSVESSFYLPACSIVVVLLLAVNVLLNRKRSRIALDMLRTDAADLLIYGTLLIVPVVLVMIYPVLATGHLTSVYRVGPDLMQYTKMAEFLKNGGTLALSKLRVDEFAGMAPGDMNRYADATMSWPLMNYFRWGITFYHVLLGKVTGISHSYQIVYASMAIPYLLNAGIVYVWLRKINASSVVVALFGFLLIAFNVNMLNLWYEGFLGNAYANVLLSLLVLLFAQLLDEERPALQENLRYVALLGTVIAALLTSYGEVLLFVFPLFVFMVIVSELLLYRNVQWRSYLVLFGGGLLGLAIVLPCNYLVEWAVLTVNQLLKEGGNGYAQPLWAIPNDILGYGDIYSYLSLAKAGKLMERSVLDWLLGLSLSIIVVVFIITGVVRDLCRSRAIKLAGLAIILTAGVLVFLKSPDNNYTYMKVYVVFAPLMVIAFMGGASWWSGRTVAWEGTRSLRLLFLVVPVILNGVLYVMHYARQATVIEEKQMKLSGKVWKIDAEHVLMVPYNLGSRRLVYSAIWPGLWAVPEFWSEKQWQGQPSYPTMHAGKKLYLLAEKEPNAKYAVRGDIVFEDAFYLIVDSKMRVEDILSDRMRDCDFNVVLHAIQEQRQE